jgi:superfamily II DNA or RNA helicase
VVVQLPTGGGKTEILRALRPDLVIAPGVDLVRQLAGRVPGALVETIQGLARRLARGEALPEAERVAVDEARLALAPQWRLVIEHYLSRGAELILTDATPATADGRGLGVVAEELYQAAGMRELIEAGYLVPFKIIAPDTRTDDLAASPIDAWTWQTPGQSAIVFAENKGHTAGVVESFTAQGVSVALITDDTSERQRAWILRALADGSLTVAVCAQILRQGIDVPRVSSIILARGVGSYPLWMQAIGRGARPFDGKRCCTVLDLRGAFHVHGHPEDPMIWGLDGSVMPASDALPPCVRCDACGAWGTGGACQICGAALPPPGPPRVRARDLFEQRATEPDAKKQATLGRYVREALSRGHNPWSARHKYKGTYGVDAPDAWFREALRDAKDLRSRQGTLDLD